MRVEPCLHNDRPNVDAYIEDHDGEQPDLGAAALADVFEVEDVAEGEAADTVVRIALKMRDTHMQKNGEMRDERALARTEK